MIGEIRQLADVKPATYQVNTSGQLELIPYKSIYKCADFTEFVCWIITQSQYQLDIETNVTDHWNEYQLISIQFGSCEFGEKRIQWFFQWSYLTDEQKLVVKRILEDRTKLKLIHNARFEYIVLRFHGIIIDNVYDTMVAEKILHGGEVSEDYALMDISWKYLRIIMNKDEQTNFGDNIITDNKIRYGITDVAYLDVIKRQQLEQAAELDQYGFNQLNTFGLEMEALLAFADITYEGMLLDQDKWRENIELAQPVIQEASDKLNRWLDVSPFKEYALQKGYISGEDRLTINYNAPQQRNELLKLLYPDIKGGTLAIVRKYMIDNSAQLTFDDLELLHHYLEKDYTRMSERLMKEHREELIKLDYLIPAGISILNWMSRDQVLPMAQLVEKKLQGLAKEDIEKTTHPMLKDLQGYKQAMSLTSDYGEKFIREHVDSDGKVRTNFNLILTTGRVSSSKPNMQNIIVNKLGVGTRYRNAFICEKDWCYCDSDYVSQELVIIAHISGDPVWNEAISKGQDLHSICAALVFGDRWRNATESNCHFYHSYVDENGTYHPVNSKHKCSCKKHKKLRDQVKEINFGLAYGMGEFKLAGKLGITVPEAMKMIKEYFRQFPRIGEALRILGEFGVDHGYIMTLAPFWRKRWFPYWSVNKDSIEPHKLGVYYNKALGEIERASKNMPIQGASADITKVAMVMIRQYIRDHDLWDKVKIVAQVHDQITTICRREFAEQWKPIMDQIMKDAGKVVIPSGILKADTQLTECWTK